MRRIFGFAAVVVLTASAASAREIPLGTVTNTDAGSGNNAVWNFTGLDAGFLIAPASKLTVIPSANAFVCVDSHVGNSGQVNCTSSNGIPVAAGSIFPTSCAFPGATVITTEFLVDGGTPSARTPATCSVACVPQVGSSVSCGVWSRYGDEARANVSTSVTPLATDGGAALLTARAGWEQINAWQIPAGSTQAWDGGSAPAVCLLPDAGYRFCSSFQAGDNADVSAYSATMLVCQVATVTAGATVTIHSYPTSNFTSVAAAPVLANDTGSGMVSNSNAIVFHGLGAGSGSAAVGQNLRDDLMMTTAINRLTTTGNPDSTMGALECRFYGRR